MNPLAQAAAALWTATAAVGGEPVTYSRGNASVVLTAVPSRPELLTDDMTSARLEARSLDWTILSAALVLSGTPTEPKERDRIVRANAEVYELTRDPARLSDSEGIRTRIHAKRVA